MTKKDQSQAKDPAAGGDAKHVTELTAKVEELTAQANRLTEIAARSQAELQNVKIRLQKEADELRKYALESAFKKLLPIVDNLQRALKHLPKDIENNEWVKGIVATEQAFLKELQALGLTRFESLGQHVDAQRHEILMVGPGAVDTVVEVLEEGYELHGKVIRPAKVKVGGG